MSPFTLEEKKLTKLFDGKAKSTATQKNPQNTVRNFSSYALTAEETYILSFGLDHHIESKMNPNKIKTEFEAMYHHLEKKFQDLPSHEKDALKSKVRRTCENYINIPSKSQYEETIKNLTRNKNIVILRQDKGRGVVLMNKSKYIEKCMLQLETQNFAKLKEDPTQRTERKVQDILREIKNDIGEEAYKNIYPSGSNPGKFYGTAKIHKLSNEEEMNINNVDRLPLRPIVSNIGTATYKTSKFLAKLLAPLGKSKYTVSSTQEFINKLKDITPPDGYEMISFDVVSLFTNVPLEKTIDIIINKVYKEKRIKTKIKANKLRALLYLCTKEGHFTFNDEIYVQIDGVMMGSPLGSLIANIFMCELETSIIPKMMDKIKLWTRYVDDTFAFVKPTEIESIHRQLNAYDQHIQFTYESEKERLLPFLDVMIKRNDSTLETSVYRKKTNSNLYMNWNSYSPRTWKIGTLRNLTRRAIMISSPNNLQKELDHLRKVFCDINNYPTQITNKIIAEEVEKQQRSDLEEQNENENDDQDETEYVQLNLPYGGNKGQHLMRKLERNVERSLKGKVKVRTTYTPCKLGSRFSVKDKTKLAHRHNVSYHISCANKKCTSDYVGETKRRILPRTMEHNSKDAKSHVLIHSKQTKHRRVFLPNVKIIGSGYRTNFRRKISEALYIKELKPDLNVQKEAYKLKLFN